MKTSGKWAVIALVLAGARAAGAGVELQGDRIVVESDKGRAVIERGMVTELMNKLTGETYTNGRGERKSAGLAWHRTQAYMDERATVTLAKTAGNAAQIEATLADGHRLTTIVTLDPASQDMQIRQTASTKDKGLVGAQWAIEGLESARVRTLVPGHSGVRLDENYPTPKTQFAWPVGWEVQMTVVEGGRGGMAVWSQDTQMRFKTLKWERTKGNVTLSFLSQNFAPFDELTEVESCEWRLAFHEGDWRVPARRYRDWMEKTYGLKRLEDQTPGWVRAIRFLVIMGMDTKILDALKAHVRPEATLLYIPNWRQDPYDHNYPDYTAAEGFGEFVKYARAMGYHVMPHMNYFGCHERNPAYERFKAWHMRDPFTREFMYWVPSRLRLKAKKDEFIPWKFAYINPASKAWRDELTRRLVEAQEKYGFDAIHLDQTLCIANDLNGKIDGMYCAEGNIALHRQLRQAMPQVALSGEGLDEITCQYEAFAQRHAANAVDHNYGTWNDAFIACAHPISSYFLSPYTTIYGYLGMCNPQKQGLYLAWKQAYERWGVIPTFARPNVSQLEADSETVKALLREAQVWVADELTPDFDGGPLGSEIKFRLKGKDGVKVVYADDGGGSRMVRTVGEKAELVYRIVKGQQTVTGKGTIADWWAYDDEKIFGLDPDNAYLYCDTPRDLHATRVSAAPEDARVRVLMRDKNKFMAEFESLPQTAAFDFVKNVAAADTGIILDGKAQPLDHGGTFMPGQGTCADVMKPVLFAHPPWQIKAKGPEPPQTFGRYRVKLPEQGRADITFAIGIRDLADARTDGAQFRVEVNGEAVCDGVWAKSEWKTVTAPLDKWRGKEVSVTFITTPGPKGDASFDWALWGEPKIRFEAPARRVGVRAESTQQAGLVTGSDLRVQSREQRRGDGMWVYDINMEMPGRVLLLSERPRTARLPVHLAEERFTTSFTVRDMPAKGPLPHAGAAPGAGKSSGEERKGLNAHPPDQGRTSADYALQLPHADKVTLSFAVALRDGSQSQGVIFIVEANGRELYRHRVTQPDGWHPAKVDLSAYAGKAVLLSLIVDADGPFSYDWAMWADPVLQ